MSATIAQLQQEHTRLWTLLQMARCDVVDGALASARAHLIALAALQHAHIAREEHAVLPNLPAQPRWHAAVYLAEHHKLQSLLQELVTRFDDTPAHSRNATLQLALLDAMHPFCHVLEHHVEREEKALFIECLQSVR